MSTPSRVSLIAGRALATWALLLIIAIANGWFRESVLLRPLGATWGHAVSSLTLCAGIFIATLATIRWIAPRGLSDASMIGAAWALLTVAFEFGFGRMRGRSWAELLADYDVASGRIWILVLIVIAVAPALAAALRHVPSGGSALLGLRTGR
jgi:hypothetical protein